MNIQHTIKLYYRLTKPGIIYGNLLTTSGGFLLASKGYIDSSLFIATLAGIACIIASACVFNNYIDRNIDKHMARTKKRALVTRQISGINALIYAFVLGQIGFFILAAYNNRLTLILGVIAYVVYIVFYGIAKRRSIHGTLIGSIPGSLPLVAGYTAVTGRLDTGAILLFTTLACWQMAHFYGIALYRRAEYAEANVPVMPVVKGEHITKVLVVTYIAAFTVSAFLLTVFGVTGYTYAAFMVLLGSVWLARSAQGFSTQEARLWGKRQFLFSLIVLLAFSGIISVDAWLP